TPTTPTTETLVFVRHGEKPAGGYGQISVRACSARWRCPTSSCGCSERRIRSLRRTRRPKSATPPGTSTTCDRSRRSSRPRSNSVSRCTPAAGIPTSPVYRTRCSPPALVRDDLHRVGTPEAAPDRTEHHEYVWRRRAGSAVGVRGLRQCLRRATEEQRRRDHRAVRAHIPGLNGMPTTCP